MPRLIRMNDKDSFTCIDADRITAVIDDVSRDELHIYSAEGPMLHLAKSSWKIDTATLVQRLSAAGKDLVNLSMRADRPIEQYFCPHAVCYVTASNPDSDGKIDIKVGLTGTGNPVESYQSPAEELTRIMDNLAKTGRRMLAFTGDKVRTEYNSAVLHIDPAAVTMVSENSGRGLSVRIRKCHVLSVDHARMSVDAIAAEITPQGETPSLEARFNAQGIKADREYAALTEFAGQIAKGNPSLHRIEGSSRIALLETDQIRTVTFNDENESHYMIVSVGLRDSSDRGCYSCFDSPEKRQVAFESLSAASGNAPAPQVPAFTPPKRA